MKGGGGPEKKKINKKKQLTVRLIFGIFQRKETY
jgi:hypothetical protein